MLLPLRKQIFVTTMAAGACSEPLEYQSSPPIKVEDVLGSCYFERKAANPIDHIPPWRHASRAIYAVRAPRRKCFAGKGVTYSSWAPKTYESWQEEHPAERS